MLLLMNELRVCLELLAVLLKSIWRVFPLFEIILRGFACPEFRKGLIKGRSNDNVLEAGELRFIEENETACCLFLLIESEIAALLF